MSHSVIIGEARDLHVRAVVDCMQGTPTLVDAASLSTAPFLLDGKGTTISEDNSAPQRGWIRRLAPPGWLEVADGGDYEAAVRSSFLAVLAAVLRAPGTEWLTPVDIIGATENKIIQYQLVGGAGCPVPEWLVTTTPDLVSPTYEWVAKPLGPAHYQSDDGPKIVPVMSYDAGQGNLLSGAAFLLQRLIHAEMHARVVTVEDQSFCAALRNTDLPIDWRSSPEAHSSFVPWEDEELQAGALLAAKSCGVGYSSQDWILDADGRWWFLDLNPSGQWLFLPESVSGAVTMALANWLDGDNR